MVGPVSVPPSLSNGGKPSGIAKKKQPTKSPESINSAYKEAGKICNEIQSFARTLIQPGASVRAICAEVNKRIEETEGAKQAFPCSISMNATLCHCSPADDEQDVIMREGDVAKIELGVAVDGCACLSCTSVVVGTGTTEPPNKPHAQRIIELTEKATRALINAINDKETNASVVESIKSSSFSLPEGFSYIEGMMSHRLAQGALSTDDIIVLKPVEGQSKMVNKRPFQVGQVWAIDVAVSDTAHGKVRNLVGGKTTIFARSGSNTQLKLLSSRQGYSKTISRYGNFGFNIQQFINYGLAGQQGKGKAALSECASKGVLVPYDQLQVVAESAEPIAARFLATVLVTADGAILLTDPFTK
jgi:methionine aminopeptidase